MEMTKDIAMETIATLLSDNGIKFTMDKAFGYIRAVVGRIEHFFSFSEKSVSIMSYVWVGKKEISTSHMNKWYRDIEKIHFHDNELWIHSNGLGFFNVNMAQG